MTKLISEQQNTPTNVGYYRFPTIYQDTVIFTAEGDLWKIDLAGTDKFAQRITTHHGEEKHPAISSDGKWIAFNAQYDGPIEAYVMPMDGGKPKRLTYDDQYGGTFPRVSGWTPDGKVIVCTNHYSTLPNSQLLIIDPHDLTRELLPLSQADEGAYGEKGDLFFTRLPSQTSHTKRYKGGYIQQLWRFDGKKEAIPLTTDYEGTSKSPLWMNGRLYFLSDRDGSMNIWSADEEGKDLRQISFSKEWDLKSLSGYGGKLVYQKGADICLIDLKNQEERTLEIALRSDFDQRRKRWQRRPIGRLQSLAINHDGNHVALNSRGRVFSKPVKGGRWAEVSRGYGQRHKAPRFLGKKDELVLLSDASGEMELWKYGRQGLAEGEQLTTDSKILIWEGIPSHNGRYIAFDDKDNVLRLYDTENKSVNEIASSISSGFYGISWSMDDQWLAYVNEAENSNSQIHLYNLAEEKVYTITTDRLDSYMPRFSPDGKWLYFVSDRTFENEVSSPWGARQPEPFFQDTANIFMLALQAENRCPFLAPDELNPSATEKKESDKEKEDAEVFDEDEDEYEDEELMDEGELEDEDDDEEIDEEDEEDEEDEDEDEEEKSKFPAIEIENLSSRLYQVPVAPGNITKMEIAAEHIYWTERDSPSSHVRRLYALKVAYKEDQDPIELSAKLRSFQLSGDRKKMLAYSKNDLYVFKTDGKKPDLIKSKVDLKDWTFIIDPVEEWKQMMVDAWRLERDYFYDKNMHGVDWKACLERHLPLVPRVTDRSELDDLIAQMVSELSALHTFVYGGDKRVPQERVRTGYLGARLSKEDKGYRVEHIYKNDPDYPDELSPLSKPHLNIKEDHIITAVNGRSVLEVDEMNELLLQQVGKQVRLDLLNEKGEAYPQIVYPISTHEGYNLRYSEWEYTRRLMVEELSDKRIGYVHLRAMSGDNYQEWIKQFYPIYRKEGLIIDVRHNRGGNIDSWILEKLQRKAWNFFSHRVEQPDWNMQYAFRGHMVVLMNERTCSNGESLAEGFRRLGMGKVIGMRSWGGGIWLTSSNRLMDRGIATASEFGVYDENGEWLIEGHGVDPDMEVDNLPHATFKGKDAQIEAAVKHLQKLIKKKPITIPGPPEYPDKSFKYD